MSDKKVFSLADLKDKKTNGKLYDDVEVYGGTVKIGSLSSGDMLEWLEASDDPAKKREQGLRLIVKSVVDPETMEHLPEDEATRNEYLTVFRDKDARENGKLIKKILVLNGLDTKAKEQTKNESSEVAPGASLSDSPSQ